MELAVVIVVCALMLVMAFVLYNVSLRRRRNGYRPKHSKVTKLLEIIGILISCIGLILYFATDLKGLGFMCVGCGIIIRCIGTKVSWEKVEK
jgi:hypothetical protein